MHTSNAGYVKGDYWMRCDLCGMDHRRSQMRKRWDGLWTCPEDWEPRHPQEFVRAIQDKQSVPVARPDVVDFTNTTTLTADVAKDAVSISVASVTGIAQYFSIGIDLDNGTLHWDRVAESPTALVVTLTIGLRGAASSGNTVYVRGDTFQTSETGVDDL